MELIDQIRGCLFGGAIGDALGYPVEFDTITEIKDEFGPQGITSYELVYDEKTDGYLALVSDDTQMTLFTAVGTIASQVAKYKGNQVEIIDMIRLAYKDWYFTQNHRFKEPHIGCKSWIMGIEDLYSLRAPGNTCLSALEDHEKYDLENIANDSKGCGGIMRIAPIALYLRNLDGKQIAMEAAKASAITHGHSLGYMPSAALAYIIDGILRNGNNDQFSLEALVKESILVMEELFAGDPYLEILVKKMNEAIECANNKLIDRINLSRLGKGWVAEETLAIALYCSLKYQNDFNQALITAVNHNGDSDSTGAVTGNILGALIGYHRIDSKWKNNLELKNLLLVISKDLAYHLEEGQEANFEYLVKYSF